MYKLAFEQEPVRARMCGFGDKDRRPITPPPCIRLNLSAHDIEKINCSSFILMVDLWDENGARPVNLVRHSSAAPTVSISSSTVTAYPPQEPQAYLPTAMIAPYAMNPYGQPIQRNYYAPVVYPNYPGVYPPVPVAPIPLPAPSNHTRNLIGTTAVNACRLNDPNGETGFWFILQDLSVRTEGTFRLKVSLTDISSSADPNSVVAQDTKCPILATGFSAPFTVYSAKKFPGVIESTPLSKCFAQQGIKIPIRKDGPKNLANQAEYDADDL